MDIYREIILDHYKHPRNFGHLRNPDISLEEGNITCGDRIVMEIKIDMKLKTITQVAFSGEGCAISQASASLLTEKIKGWPAEKVMKLKTQNILSMLQTKLTASRVKCAVLPLEVLQKAIGKLSISHTLPNNKI